MQQSIKDRKEFITFLENFYDDFLKNSEEWENPTLEHFLEAMIAYAKDIQGYYINTNQKTDANIASWQVFADIIRGARIYE